MSTNAKTRHTTNNKFFNDYPEKSTITRTLDSFISDTLDSLREEETNTPRPDEAYYDDLFTTHTEDDYLPTNWENFL